MLVWKFDLGVITGVKSLSLPCDAQVLAVQKQGIIIAKSGGTVLMAETAMLWATTEGPGVPLQVHQLHTVETGQKAPENGMHLATIQFMEGKCVLHYFLVIAEQQGMVQ